MVILIFQKVVSMPVHNVHLGLLRREMLYHSGIRLGLRDVQIEH